MKTVKIIAALFLATVMALSASAAKYVPSAEHYDPTWAGETEKFEGTFVVVDPTTGEKTYITIDGNEPSDEVKDSLNKAENELLNNDLSDIVDDFDNKWAGTTGGAPKENAGLIHIFDIIIPENLEGEKFKVEFTVDELTDDDNFVIIYKPDGSDTWQVIDYTIDENGKITIEVGQSGTFAIITDTTVDPTPGDDSPQTGVKTYSVAVIACAVALCGVAFVVIRKASKNRTVA